MKRTLESRLVFSPSKGSPGTPSKNERSESLIDRISATLASATPRKKEGSSTTDPVQVCLRIRPLSQEEQTRKVPVSLTPIDGTTISVQTGEGTEGRYSFSHVFRENEGQREVFEATGRNLVDSLFEGRNGLLFAYGITGSGKTFTIQGTREARGIMPRTLDEVFDRIKDMNAATTTTSSSSSSSITTTTTAAAAAAGDKYEVSVSYLEVYNDQVYDLLAVEPAEPVKPGFSMSGLSGPAANLGPKRTALSVKEDGQGNIFVKGLREVKISSVQEGEAVLSEGQANRAVASTNINVHSSRSHSIFEIVLTKTTATHVRSSKLFLVDLAGSERQSRTQSSGLRLKEASCINSSLMTLGRCMETLRWNQMHPQHNPKVVPYRNSKMTRLFQGPLSGGRAYMIVNVDKTESNLEETINCLKYSAIARDIATVSRVNTGRSLYPTTPTAKASPAKGMGAENRAANAGDDDVNDDDDDDNDAAGLDAEALEELEEENEALKARLIEAERRIAEIEVEVRQETAAKFTQLIEEQRVAYEMQIEQAREVASETNSYAKKAEYASNEYKRQRLDEDKDRMIEELRGELERNIAEMNDIKETHVQSISLAKTAADAQVKALERRCRQAEEARDAEHSKASATEESLFSRVLEVTELQGALRQAREVAESYRSVQAGLERDIAERDARIADLEAKIAHLEADRGTLMARVASVENLAAEHEVRAAQTQEAMLEENAALKDRVAALEAGLRSAQADARAYHDSVQTLRTQLAAASQAAVANSHAAVAAAAAATATAALANAPNSSRGNNNNNSSSNNMNSAGSLNGHHQQGTPATPRVRQPAAEEMSLNQSVMSTPGGGKLNMSIQNGTARVPVGYAPTSLNGSAWTDHNQSIGHNADQTPVSARGPGAVYNSISSTSATANPAPVVQRRKFIEPPQVANNENALNGSFEADGTRKANRPTTRRSSALNRM